MPKYRLLGSALLMSLSFITMWEASATQVNFKPPRTLAPRNSTGGASRGNNCLLAQTAKFTDSVIPLLPLSRIGFTVKERPAIFVYIPQTTAKKALLSVQDQQGTNHYQTTIDLPEKPGVMAIKLPNSMPALKTGKNYQWTLVIICSAELEPDSPSVSGWIRRVQLPVSLKNLGNLSASLELVSRLAKSDLWYDTIFELARLRQAQPNNRFIRTSWQQVLNSVGLNAIANEPLTN